MTLLCLTQNKQVDISYMCYSAGVMIQQRYDYATCTVNTNLYNYYNIPLYHEIIESHNSTSW